MKKKIFSVMTAIAATTASLLCFACDGNTPDDGTTKFPPAQTTAAETLRTGVQGLYKSDSYKAELTATLKSKNDATGTEYEFSLEKSGNRLRVNADGEYIVDLDTGYAYAVGGVTTYFQAFPAAAYDYIVKLMDESDIDEADSDDIKYDNDGNVVVSLDIKNDVNEFTEPFRMTYAGGTLVSLINEFLIEDDTTLQELLEVMEETIVQNKNISASFIILTVDTQLKRIDPSLSVKKIFQAFGITDEQYAAVGRRTAGELAEGMLSLQSKITELLPSDGDTENADPNEIAQTIFNALFVDEVDASNVEEDIVGMKDDIISMLSGFKISDIVDGLCARLGSDELKDIIANNVKFTALGMNAKVSFYNNGNISAVEFGANAKHDFIGTGSGVLGDNDYSVSCELKFTDYSSDAAKITVPNNLAAFEGGSVYAFAHDGAAKVYIETGAHDGALVINSVTVGGEPCESSHVSYDQATHVLTFDQALISSVEAETAGEIVLEGTIGDSDVTVTVYVLPDISWEAVMGAVRSNG